MIAMIRMPRVRLSLVLAALVILLVVPMVGARTLNPPSIYSAAGGWLGAALTWVEGFAGLTHRGHTGSQMPLHRKDDPTTNKPAGGGCIGPDGRPKPLCL
jgi:hypothetical protein